MSTSPLKTSMLLLVAFFLCFASSCKEDLTLTPPEFPMPGGDGDPDDPDDPMIDPEASRLTLDFTQEVQTIDHFGASDAWSAEWIGRWPEGGKKQEIAELLFSREEDAAGNPKGIGLSKWRFNLGDGSADQSDSGFRAGAWDRETECFLQENGTYDWDKQAGSQWFLNQAKAYGVEKFTFWTTTPPYFMTKNGYTFRTADVSGFNLQTAKYDDYAEHMAEVLLHFQEEGTPIEIMSPVNETQYPWQAEVGSAGQSGTYATNAEVARLAMELSAALEAKNVGTEIMIPEAGALRYLYGGSGATENQLNRFFTPSSPLYVGDLPKMSTAVAAHSYFSTGSIEAMIDHRKRLRDRMQSIDPNLRYWQTEYSLLSGDYLRGRTMASMTPIDYALWLARIVQTDLVHGNAAGWSFWTAISRSNFQDHQYRFNFIRWIPNSNGPEQTDGDFVTVKNLWAFGNFSRFVRPGMVRIEALDARYSSDEAAAEEVMISAFRDPATDEVVLVAINFKQENHKVHLDGYGTDYSFAADQLTTYTTSANRDLIRGTTSAGDITLPARSITTLTGKLQ